jgi:peroxiredoxin
MVLTKSEIKLQYGDKAEDFDLQGVDGKQYSLANFGDKKGLLVVFMCNHCPYVKAKMPAIVDLYKKFGDPPAGEAGSIEFIGVNSNDPEYPGEGMEHMKQFAIEQGMEFPYVLDDTQETAKAYGATCTPDPFLFTLSEVEGFDKDFKLVFHGRINNAMEPGDTPTENTMEMKMQKLLAGEEIADEFKPSMGCSIKWLS